MADNGNRWQTSARSEAMATAGMEIRVDRTKCVGSGQCLISAAEYFGQDVEGYVLLLSSAPGEELYASEDVREAVANCPSGALSWWARELE